MKRFHQAKHFLVAVLLAALTTVLRGVEAALMGCVVGPKFESALCPGAHNYPATCATQGRVFTTAGDKLFVLDPLAMRGTQTIQLPASQIEISLSPLGQEKLAGLTTQGVYIYDIKGGQVVHRARSPVPVRCGFALLHDAVYFGSNAELWRYHIPRSLPAGELDPVNR